MNDFIVDKDIWIPSGVPADSDDIAKMVAEELLPPAAVEKIHEDQRPNAEQLGHAANKYGKSDVAAAKQRMRDAGLTVEDIE